MAKPYHAGKMVQGLVHECCSLSDMALTSAPNRERSSSPSTNKKSARLGSVSGSSPKDWGNTRSRHPLVNPSRRRIVHFRRKLRCCDGRCASSVALNFRIMSALRRYIGVCAGILGAYVQIKTSRCRWCWPLCGQIDLCRKIVEEREKVNDAPLRSERLDRRSIPHGHTRGKKYDINTCIISVPGSLHWTRCHFKLSSA